MLALRPHSLGVGASIQTRRRVKMRLGILIILVLLPTVLVSDLSGRLTGRIVFDPTEELPKRGYVALVNLTTLPPGIPSMGELESRIIARGGISGSRTSPVPFTILYDPEDIEPNQHYAVLVYYTWGEGRGITSRSVTYTNAYQRGYNPARVLTHNYPSDDVEVRIAIVRVIS